MVMSAMVWKFHEVKIKCSIQRGVAKLNRTFYLSPHENICTIARMKNIHYLFYNIKKYLLSFITLK